MNSRITILIGILLIICTGLASPAHAANAAKEPKQKKAGKEATAAKKADTESIESKFRLKPGAQLKICLTCHPQFEDLLKKPFVHTPIKKTGCTACHSPHTTRYPKQLKADVSVLCLTCHDKIMPKDARSSHRVAIEGKCILCHDPHAADNKSNLRRNGNDLCYDCHKNIADFVSKAKFKHNPVEKGCINCHNPHASPKAAALLKNDVPALCKDCHQIDKPIFTKQHMSYPVANSRCTICHSVHGSDRAGIIYSTAHPPFASKMCNQCHEGPGAANPVALKKKGFELCRGCHSTMVNDMFSKNRLHWAAVGKEGCANCHTPHASSQRNLLKDQMIPLCGKCHADTIQRLEKSPTKHEPIKEGMCTVCHTPHASDNVLLLTQTSIIELCGKCHDWQKHATHPIGDKVTDKRNKNLTMQCLSCHRSHGTEYKHMLPVATVTELCVQCHTEKMR